jgi:hypothetical protein
MPSPTTLLHLALTALTLHTTTTLAISRGDSRAVYEHELVARSGCLYSSFPNPCTRCLGGAACNEGVGPVANGGIWSGELVFVYDLLDGGGFVDGGFVGFWLVGEVMVEGEMADRVFCDLVSCTVSSIAAR